MRASRRARLAYDELDDLAARAHPDNPKRHDLTALDSSVGRFGYVTPIVVNDTDGRILEGHGRVETLLRLRACGAEPPLGIQVGPAGGWRVPTVHGIELSPDDARAFVIAANRTVELGGWDEARLAEVLSDLARSKAGLDAVGFSEADLSALLEGLGIDAPLGGSDPDHIPEEPAEDQLYVAPGQLWRLGEHRLLSGDATRSEDVDRVLSRRNADMAITDPPYNVSYGNHGGAAAGPRRRALTNDPLPASAWEEFVRGWARQLLDHVDGALYIFMSSKEWPTVSRLLEEAGGHWSDTIIWAKDRFVLGRADYQRQYEPIWYGWRKGVRRYWYGARDQGDVWWIPRPSASDVHPTMKPVALAERAIVNSSTRGGRVLDVFLGSGTTLIAAERQGRRCLGIEEEAGGDTVTSLKLFAAPDDIRTIVSYAAGPHVAIDQTATHSHVDELAHMPFPEKTWSAIQTTVAPNGSCHIVTRGAGDDNFAATLWSAADSGQSPLVPFFAPWNARPDRDRRWREEQVVRLPYQGFLHFAPESAEDALAGDETAIYIPLEVWDRCYDPGLPPLMPGDRTPIVLGVDAGVTGDMFAIVAVSRHPRRPDDPAIRACKAWRPSDSGGRVDFDEAERFIRFLCNGGCPSGHPREMPHSSCEACAAGNFLVPRHNVVEIVYDPYQMEEMAQRLRRDGVAWCEEFSQTTERLVADSLLHKLALRRALAHHGDPLLREHIGNARAKLSNEDSRMRIIKRAPDRKIDLAVAASMAVQQVLYLNL